jgi:hypothetical protein
LGIAGTPPLFTDKETSYMNLVNVAATGAKCGASVGAADGGGAEAEAAQAGAAEAGAVPVLVAPGHPESSLLYQKIENPSPPGLCGDRMPDGQDPLADADIQQIKEWITLGAMDD